MNSELTKPGAFGAALIALTVIAIAVGGIVRLIDLSGAPLAIDEYYLAQSIRNILATGIPQFDCGGVYTRGIIQQYLTAGLTMAGLDLHLALRLIPVISSFVALPGLYVLGRKVGGTAVAFVACVLFSLSVWEIEMARFGRMYAPFQALFIWYCVALIGAYRGSGKSLVAAVALAALSVFVYEGAALLLCATFIPLLSGRNFRLWTWALAAGALSFGYMYLTADFTLSTAPPKLPEDFYNQQFPSPEAASGSDYSAAFLFLEVDALSMILVGAALLMTVWILVPLHRSPDNRAAAVRDWKSHAWVASTIWLSIAGLFGAIVSVSIAMLLWGWLRLDILAKRNKISLAIWTLTAFGFWFVGLMTTFDGSLLSRVKDTVYALFLFPDLYSEVAIRWIRSVPVLTIVSVAAVPGCLWINRKSDGILVDSDLIRFLAGLIIVLAFAVALLPTPYSTIRYTYFLHPLVIILAASFLVAMVKHWIDKPVLQNVAICVTTVLFMLTSVDYSVRHLRSINSDKTVYRIGLSKWERDRVYRRWDYRSPGEYVNSHASQGDTILTSSQAVPYYLARTTHFYAHDTGKEYATIASCRGTIERWSSASLVSNPTELEALLDAPRSGDFWAILRSADQPEATDYERTLVDINSENIVFRSNDSRLVVLRNPRSTR